MSDAGSSSTDQASEETPPDGLPQVFVSYSRRDRVLVQALIAELPPLRWKVWVDEADIQPAEEWRPAIKDAIRETQAFVFVITPDSAASTQCRSEIDEAVSIGKRVVPLHMRDTPPDTLAPHIAGLQWVDCRGDDNAATSAAKLAGALGKDVDWMRAHTWILARTHDWETAGRDRGSVLRGRQLERAERWLARADRDRDPQPTAEQTRFILASRRAATRGQRRRLVAVASVLALSMVMTTVAVILRQNELRQSHIARSRELAAAAVSELAVDPELGLMLAVQAVQTNRPPTRQAEVALRLALAESRIRQRLDGVDTTIRGLAVAPATSPLKGDVAIGSTDGSVRLWDLRNGKRLPDAPLLKSDPGHGVTSVFFDPDGTRLLATLDDGTAYEWTLAQGQGAAAGTQPAPATIHPLAAVGGGRINAGAIGRDGVAVFGGVHGAVTWNGAPGGSQPLVHGLTQVTAVARSDRQIAVLSSGTVTLYASAGSPEAVLTDGVTAIAFDRSGNRLATAGSDGSIQLWDTSGPAPVRAWTLRGHSGSVTSVAFSADGAMVAAGGTDSTAIVWNTRSGWLVTTLRGHTAAVRAVAFEADGDRLVTAGDDRTVRIWDVTQGAPLAPELADAGPPVAHIAVGGDNAYALIQYQDGPAEVRELLGASHASTQVAIGEGGVLASAIDPVAESDGTRVVIATTSRVLFFRVHPGVPGDPPLVAEPIPFDDSGVPRTDAVAFDTSGGYVVFGGARGNVVRQDLTTHERRSPRHEAGTVSAVAVAPDGRVAFGMRLGKVFVWDPVKDVTTKVGSHRGPVLALAFSPTDSRYVASASTDSKGIIWDTRKLRPPVELLGHLGNVNALSYSQNGDKLVTGSNDGTIRIWIVGPGEGKLDALMPLHAGPVTSLVYGSDTMLVSTAFGRIASYRCDLCSIGASDGALVRQAQKWITRSFTCSEDVLFLQEVCPKPERTPEGGGTTSH